MSSGQFFCMSFAWVLAWALHELFFGCHKVKSYSISHRIHRHAHHSGDRYDNEFCKRICRRIRSGHAPPDRTTGLHQYQDHDRKQQRSTRRTPEVHLEKTLEKQLGETLEMHSEKWRVQCLFFKESNTPGVDYDDVCILISKFPNWRNSQRKKLACTASIQCDINRLELTIIFGVARTAAIKKH